MLQAADPAFQVDPNPDPGFGKKKNRKNTDEIFCYLFLIKNCNLFIYP
jgi:hypothetical protein